MARWTSDQNAAARRRDVPDADAAERAGRYQEAARLFMQLGKDLQAQHGPFDARALDAFERAPRAARQSADAS